MSRDDTMLSRIVADAVACHRRMHAAATPTISSALVAALRSRGFLVAVVHRLSRANVVWEPRGAAARLVRCAAGGVLAVARYGATVLTKSQIGRETDFDAGVYLSRRGHIVIGARSIGAGTVIGDRVTIGRRADDATATPQVGERVWIGASSVLYGGIRVGDGATILPASIVSINVPARAVVGGNPGKILRLDFDNAQLLATGRTDRLPMLGG